MLLGRGRGKSHSLGTFCNVVTDPNRRRMVEKWIEDHYSHLWSDLKDLGTSLPSGGGRHHTITATSDDTGDGTGGGGGDGRLDRPRFDIPLYKIDRTLTA